MLFQEDEIYRGQRRLLIEDLARDQRLSEKVLRAMGMIPRQVFVEKGLEHLAYENSPIAIGANQTISAPQTVALQTTLLNLKGGEKILEIGTGCGYQTAILFYLGATVFSIERQEELFLAAIDNLTAIGYKSDDYCEDNLSECENECENECEKKNLNDNVEENMTERGDENFDELKNDLVSINPKITLKWGDGFKGWQSEAPFDGIIVTCGAPYLPDPLLEQLKIGGRLVIPVATSKEEEAKQQLIVIERIEQKKFQRTIVGEANFVAMLSGKEKIK